MKRENYQLVLGTFVGYRRQPGLYGPLWLREMVNEEPAVYGCADPFDTASKPMIFMGDELAPASRFWTDEALAEYVKTYEPPTDDELSHGTSIDEIG
jgi:hypothetical protein